MSFNQSKAEKSESHYKKNFRSGNSGGVQRSFSGSAGGKVGGGNAPPPQSINSSFRKAVEKAVDGQRRVTVSNPNTQANISAGRQNGTHVESSLSGFTEAPPPFAASKPTNPPAPKSTRPAPKPPSSQPTNGVSKSAAPATPVKADVTKSFPLQFGSISPGVVNVMQIPPRTSSAPPNLDEQKREQVTHDSLRAPPAIPASPAPKQVHSVKEAGLTKPSTTMEPHVASSQPTRDVHPQIPSTPVGTTISQKPSVLPKHAMSIPMAYQSQVPISFSPNSQLQSQGVPTSLQMPLSMGSGTQVQQKIFVPNVQSHPIHPHGMTPQSQNLNFATQIGHQMPPQMSNVGISIPPQFPQQAGNFGSLRKAVKITHPDTHEELRLDKKTDSHKISGSSGPRSHPNVPPQSQPSPSFTPHQVNYYPPIRPGYNTLYYPTAQTGVPLTGTQMTTGPPAARYAYPVSQSPAISFKNPSTPKHLPAPKHVPLVQSASEQLIVEYPHHSKAVTGSVSMPPVQVTVNPTVVSLGEKVRTSSVTVSAPVNKSESPDVPKEGISTLRQGDSEITSGTSNQQSKSVFEPTASRPPSITEKISTAKSADALVQRLPTCTTSSASVLPEESASVVANTEGRQGETVRRMEPSKDRQKKAGRKDAKNTQFHNQDDAPKPAGSSEASSPRMSVEQSPSVLSSQDLSHSKSFKDGDSVEGSTTKGTSGGLSVSSEEPSPDVSVSVTDVDFKEPLPDVSQDAKELVNVQLKQECIGTVEERTGVSEGINENSQYSVIPSDSKCSESSEGNKQMEMETDIKETTVTKESSSLVEQKNEESVDLCSSENERTADNLVLSASTSDSVDAEISTSCGSSTSSHDKRTSNTDASTPSIDRASSQDLSSTHSATSHQDSHPDSSIVSSYVTLKHESKGVEGVEVTGGSLVSVSGSKDSSTSETNKVKSTTVKGKKKRKDILKAADAAGSTSDLYMAYKGPEERQENASASSSENINRSSSVEVKQEPADDTVKNVTVAGEDDQTKAEPDDWEDAAEISTPKLKPSGVGKQALVGSLSQNEDGKMSKKYSRDFLLTLSEQFTDLPADFEIGPDIAEFLMGIPNAGRNVDRANGGPRPDRRGGGIVEDDKWNKGQSHFVPGRDPRFDGGHGGGVVGFRPGQGGTHGVSRNPRGQVGGQYAGGILSGPLQSPGSQVGMQRNNAEADRWQRATGFQKGLIPSPQTPLQIMHKAEKKYEIRKVSDLEEAKQRQLKAILNKLTPQNFDKLFEQVKEVNIDNAVTLTGVISQIFDKALMEPTFCETYANFCFHLSVELPDFSENNEKITFKRVLLNKCQEEFERGEREQAEANRVEEDGEVKCSEAEREEKRIQARRRMLGNIRLIGELYKKKMLTEKIMHECIKKLLGQNQTPDEEDIESLCKLMSTIGEMIDHPKAKEHMDAYFEIMRKFSNNMKLSSRVRFMLKDAIDLRKNKWQQRRKVEGPKKIDEVHRDAAQERQAQATRLARPSVAASARRGHPLDFGPRGSTMSSSPNSQIGGHRGFPPQVRGYAQDTRVEERHHFESRTLSVPLSQRPLDDNSITLGPQGGLARGMSVRGQSLVSGIPLVDIPPNEPRRYAAGQNGYSAAERTPYPREVSSRYTPERPTGMPAYDQSNLQERNAYLGTRDIRSADRVKDRSVTSSPTSVQDSPTANAWPEERLKDMSISAIREFYSAKDMEEVALCVRDLKSPSFYPSMISIWITDSFERKDLERDLLAKLLVDLTRPQDSLLGQGQLIKGFESVLATLEDTVTYAPKAPDFLGRILAKLIVENVVPLREIGQLIHEGGEEPGRLRQIGLAADVLGSILEMIKLEKGESVLNEMRVSSSLHLEDFRPPAPIKSRRLEAFF